MLAAAAVVLSAVVLAIGLVRGQGAELMVVTAISLVVAAVPESLPAVVTLALALGARRMSARNALIRRLPAVETLGSVTVLGTDKTGTLTQGNMVVRRLWTPDGGEAEIDGAGYGPDGELTRSGRVLDPGQAPDLCRLLTAGALCNDAALRPPEGDQDGVDPGRRPDRGRPAGRRRQVRPRSRRAARPVPARRRGALRQRPQADDHRAPAAGRATSASSARARPRSC